MDRRHIIALIVAALLLAAFLAIRSGEGRKAPEPPPDSGEPADAILGGTAALDEMPPLVEELVITPDAPSDGVSLEPDPKQPVTGRVVLPDGTPVAGARVVLFDDGTNLRLPGVPARHRWEEGGLPAQISGDDGTFLFPTSLAGRLHRALPAPGLLVRASGPEGVSFTVPAVLGGEDGEVGDLVLQPGFSPEVEVVTSSGEPIVGAVVEVYLWHGEGPGPGQQKQCTTLEGRTNERGRAAFVAVPRRDDWVIRVTIEHDEFAKVEKKYPAADLMAGPIRVTVAQGVTVTGVVLRPDGSPAAGYEVRAGGRRYGHSPDLPLQATAKVEEDGRFTVHGAKTRHGLISIRKSVLEFALHVDLDDAEEGETIDLGTLHMPKLGSIRGRVLTEKGDPVSQCYVFADSARGDYTGNRSARTDEEGWFEIRGVPPGLYELEAEHDFGDGDDVEGSVTDVSPDSDPVTIRLTTAGSILFLFHEKGSEEPLEILSPDINCKWGSWSGGGEMDRKRIYARPGTIDVKIKVLGFREVALPGIEVREDAAAEVHVYLERE